MPRPIMVVMTNAVEGRDEEFNRWYDDVHVRDVLAKGPFVSAERYRAAAAQPGAEPEYRYLAVYELEEGRVEEARDWLVWSRTEREEALAAGREPEIPIETGVLAEQRVSFFFEPVGERVEAPAKVA
jgi:hypothetical protein